MGEFGLKIKNIEAATLYEYNIGLRSHYDYKDAMFVNSLFKTYLEKIGMTTWREESTRDIICLEFNFGTRSYEEEITHLRSLALSARVEYKRAKSSGNKLLCDIYQKKRNKISELYLSVNKNKEKYVKIPVDELREMFYNNGVEIQYINRKRNGDILKIKRIHYSMLYRSSGKSKKGSCIFIRDRLYKKALNYLRMGIRLPKRNAKIVELSAYSSLIASGIESTVKINPENILVLKDVESMFERDVVSVETNERKECIAKFIENYKLKNTLFDGQALIDSRLFPDDCSGYILLREHFCKMAAFSTNIQLFFTDYFGENYDNAVVKDMWGNKHYAKDIEVITTDNAMKWIKFDVPFDEWCRWVNLNDNEFGIVKTSHPSKLGDVQKMSYQMVNSLDENIMESVCKESINYINRLKTDDDFFLEYLRKNNNFSNDFEVLIDLVNHNPEFLQSSYFRERRRKIIMNYILQFKSGKVLQNADNLVIVGSPYAMLLYAASGNSGIVEFDGTLLSENGCIQCYTTRFNDGEYLADFRSPFNGKYNLSILHNHYDERFKKYFNFSDQIIAVNLIHTDFQSRSNGSDQDSDSIYCTNQKEMVEHARYCYREYPTIVNNIPKDTHLYNNTMTDFARLDNKLASSQMAVGESSNLAQLAQTYDCTFNNDKYKKYICILSVIAQIAIDSSKRMFDIDINKEIQRIKKDMNVRKYKYPKFWKVINKYIEEKSINTNLHCPMDYLYDLKLDQFRNPANTIDIREFFIKHPMDCDRRKSRKVEGLIGKYSDALLDYNMRSQCCDFDDNNEKYLILRQDFDILVNDIRQVNISKNYKGLMSWLIDRCFMLTDSIQKNNRTIKKTMNKNRVALIKVLHTVNRKNFLSCFKKHTI